MQETDELPDCPRCGGSRFRRDSIFAARQDHSDTTSEFPVPRRPRRRRAGCRRRASGTPAPATASPCRTTTARSAIFRIERGWTRIGRSPTADLRLDDPSVSRRHALIVAEPGKTLRVLDDRSLNGVFVNGETVEWGPLRDGDELTIGRFSLYVLQLASAGTAPSSGHPRP